jgi:hypothetical protein
LNIALIAIDNKVGGIADTRLGDIKAITADTIATIPRTIFVSGVVFLLRPFGFVVVVGGGVVVVVIAVGKDEYNFNNIIPVATLSTPIINNIIERSKIVYPPGKIGNPHTISRADNMREIAPLPICRARNQVGGLLLVIVDDMYRNYMLLAEMLFGCFVIMNARLINIGLNAIA